MKITSVKYNPVRDVEKVTPFGAIDLCSAYANHSIPANVGGSERSYNGIEDPRSIGYRPRDSFELAQASKATLDYKPASKNAD